MKKIFFLICIFLLSFTFVYSAENEEPIITSIRYSWNLKGSTEIEINWSYLDACHKLSINSIDISIKSQTNNKITFLYSEIWKYSWKVNLECWEKIFKKDYLFPYINKITWINDNNSDKYITISWDNFWTSPIVNTKGGNFIKNFSQSRIIYWEIPKTITDKEIYITVDWLMSNIFEIDIKIPKINFIYSKNNFFKNTEIIIYWENLNYYNNSKIFFWDKEITKFKHDKEEWRISFFYNSKLWNKTIKVVSNWFESNILNVLIIWNKPIINNIYKKNIIENINWTSKTKEILVISWENFPQNLENIKLYIPKKNWFYHF